MSLSEPMAARVADIVAAHAAMEGPLLPILHAVQAEFGCVPSDAVPRIAKGLNLSAAEVHGVVSFYHDFRTEPAGHHVVKLCRAEACQAMGAERLAEDVAQALGAGFHETAGGVTVEPVFCLGLCACGPAAMVDGRLIGRADAGRIVAEVDAGRIVAEVSA
jgi:formate dehydrogenase subunit gamma